jgi:hypothetical protein
MFDQANSGADSNPSLKISWATPFPGTASKQITAADRWLGPNPVITDHYPRSAPFRGDPSHPFRIRLRAQAWPGTHLVLCPRQEVFMGAFEIRTDHRTDRLDITFAEADMILDNWFETDES